MSGTVLGVPVEPTKALFESLDGGAPITVPFNPNAFSISRTLSWSQGDNLRKNRADLTFAHGDNDQLTMSLTLDETEPATGGTGLMAVAEQFYGMAKAIAVAGGSPRPPVIAFSWGGFRFVGVVKQVQIQMLMFSREGVPVRAQIDLEMSGEAFSSIRLADDLLAPASVASGGGGGGDGGGGAYGGL